jgi:taurine dioxygenase
VAGCPSVSELAGSLGAVIAADRSDLGAQLLRGLLLRHRLLILRGWRPDPARLVQLASIFGTPRTESIGEPFELVDASVRANVWHADLTYLASPNVATLMQVLTGPPVGGDTMWANTAAAHTSLPAPLRDRIAGLRAEHRDPLRCDPPAVHPVVRRHPVTGEACLYVNRYYTARIIDMPDRESVALLRDLFDATESVHRTCRWRWQPGDVAVWDNTCTVHIGIDDYAADADRTFYRVSVGGDGPEAF